MKLELRPISDQDTENIIAWRNSSAIRRNFIQQDLITTETHYNWINNNIETGRAVQFILVDFEATADIGTVFLHSINPKDHTAEMGIFIGRDDYRGRGVCKIAVSKLLRIAFDDLNLVCVTLRVLASNKGAIHCYQKSGFQLDFVENDLMINENTKEDVWHMSIKKS